MTYEPPEGLVVERNGKTIGYIRSMNFYVSGLPTAQVTLVSWDAVESIIEALKGGGAMSLACSHCGKEIKTREPYFSGMKDGELYNLHPSCRADSYEKVIAMLIASFKRYDPRWEAIQNLKAAIEK